MTNDDGLVKIAREGGITFAGNVIGRALRFGFVVVATRVVSSSAYGTYTLAFAIVMFLQGFASLNLNRAIDYYLPQFLRDGDGAKAKATLWNVLGISMFTATIGSVLLAIAAPALADLFSDPALTTVLPLFAFAVPLVTLTYALRSSFNGIKKMKYRVYMKDIVDPAIRLIGAVVFVLFTSELIGLVLGHLLGLIVAGVIGAVLLYREADWLRSTSAGSISRRSIVSYAFPLMFAGIIYAVVAQIDYFVIGYFRPSAEVAHYRVAFMLAVNTLIILNSITPIFKPTVAEAQGDTALLSDRYQTVTRWVSMLTLPIATTFIVAPDTYLSLLFTEEYIVASGALVALSIGYLFNAAFGPEGMILEGLGYTRLTLLNTVILVGTNATLDVLLVPRFGIVGAGIATGAGLTVAGVAGIIEIYYLRGVHPFTLESVTLWTSAIPVIILTMIVAESLGSGLIVAVTLPCLVTLLYVLAFQLSGSFTQEERRIASRIDDLLGVRIVSRIIR